MKEIKCLQDLLENGTLMEGQDVVISKISYYVARSSLIAYNKINNSIFKKLSIDKDSFAEQCYGYTPRWGGWPQAKDGDYKALTRLVAGLYVYAGEIVYDKKKEEVSLRVGDKVIPLDMLSDQAILDIVHSLE